MTDEFSVPGIESLCMGDQTRLSYSGNPGAQSRFFMERKTVTGNHYEERGQALE
jgi:hypothetical protein